MFRNMVHEELYQHKDGILAEMYRYESRARCETRHTLDKSLLGYIPKAEFLDLQNEVARLRASKTLQADDQRSVGSNRTIAPHAYDNDRYGSNATVIDNDDI